MKEGSHGRNKYGSGASSLWLGFRPYVENVIVVHFMVGKFLDGLNQNLFTVTRQEGNTLLGCRRPKLKVSWSACKTQWKSDHESASEIWWETVWSDIGNPWAQAPLVSPTHAIGSHMVGARRGKHWYQERKPIPSSAALQHSFLKYSNIVPATREK